MLSEQDRVWLTGVPKPGKEASHNDHYLNPTCPVCTEVFQGNEDHHVRAWKDHDVRVLNDDEVVVAMLEGRIVDGC